MTPNTEDRRAYQETTKQLQLLFKLADYLVNDTLSKIWREDSLRKEVMGQDWILSGTVHDVIRGGEDGPERRTTLSWITNLTANKPTKEGLLFDEKVTEALSRIGDYCVDAIDKMDDKEIAALPEKHGSNLEVFGLIMTKAAGGRFVREIEGLLSAIDDLLKAVVSFNPASPLGVRARSCLN